MGTAPPSAAAAGREHDVAFTTGALRAGLVAETVLRERIAALETDRARRDHALALLGLSVAGARATGP